jgi:hemerythrin superfamily protein
MDTVALLQHEHDAVRALFGRLPAVSGPERLEFVREIAARVVLHLQLEEEFLYRALEQAGDVEARRAAADARADHALVDDLIERLLRLDPRDAEFERAVGELERRIRAHARDEEARTFPLARRALGESRLEAIGCDIVRRRARLDVVA